MDGQDTLKRTGDIIRNPATMKVLMIGLLVVVLLAPASMISSLMRERESRRDTVLQEINQKWGYSQTITGPFFTVPYKSFRKKDKDDTEFCIRYLHILPENIHISGKIDPQIRYRSIYEAVLYNVQISMEGSFTIPELGQSIDPADMLWEKALLSIGITDMRGIQDSVVVRFNGTDYKASPGLRTTDIAPSGVRCAVPLSPMKDDSTFSLELNLNGSEQIHFIPVGETTRVRLESTWPAPSFNGSFLPTNREVTDSGFAADWSILHLNRSFPQFWEGDRYEVCGSSFGLRLLIPADTYQKSMRTSKYALLFIVFTFAAFFLSEIISRQRVHPVQYLLIGLAVVLFYVLLLSISEHLGFDVAYVLSATAITTMVTGYSKSILRNNRFTLSVCAVLMILYAYLYIVLQVEDYALVMGSIGLFVVLAAVMYITRRIDWYALDVARPENQGPPPLPEASLTSNTS